MAEGRTTDESERLIEEARESADGGAAGTGTSPPAEARNQATAPPGNGELDEPALAQGLDRLEQAGGGH